MCSCELCTWTKSNPNVKELPLQFKCHGYGCGCLRCKTYDPTREFSKSNNDKAFHTLDCKCYLCLKFLREVDELKSNIKYQ